MADIEVLLLSLAFAPVFQFYLAWVGLVPWLLVVASARTWRNAFVWGFLGGWMFFLVNMWWLWSVSPPGLFALTLRWLDWRLAALAAILAVVVAPGVYRTAAEYGEAYWQGVKVAVRGPVDRDAVLVSGVWLSRPCAEELLERTRLARELGRSGDAVLLSADYFLVAKLAGLYHRPPFGSLFMEAMTKRQYRRRMRELVASQADVLLFDARVPDDIAVGDLLATPVTGAYGRSMGSNYNAITRPPVVFASDGEARLVIRRETFDDLLATDVG